MEPVLHQGQQNRQKWKLFPKLWKANRSTKYQKWLWEESTSINRGHWIGTEKDYKRRLLAWLNPQVWHRAGQGHPEDWFKEGKALTGMAGHKYFLSAFSWWFNFITVEKVKAGRQEHPAAQPSNHLSAQELTFHQDGWTSLSITPKESEFWKHMNVPSDQ